MISLHEHHLQLQSCRDDSPCQVDASQDSVKQTTIGLILWKDWLTSGQHQLGMYWLSDGSGRGLLEVSGVNPSLCTLTSEDAVSWFLLGLQDQSHFLFSPLLLIFKESQAIVVVRL